MDYDETNIPAGYDRGRDHGPEFLDLWMNVIQSHVGRGPVRTILDLGCGTGRFSAGLANRFRARVVGLDPSEKMLAQARRKPGQDAVFYQRGAAEAIPLAGQAVDVIFMSMSFHHFQDPAGVAKECRRVLREDGTIVVRTGTRERISSYPYVPFFASTPRMLEELLPGGARVRAVFETAGFLCAESQVVVQAIAKTWRSTQTNSRPAVIRCSRDLTLPNCRAVSMPCAGTTPAGWHAPMALPRRQGGGSVTAGRPYWVGEREPELFVPRQSGTILNQGQLAAAGGPVTINMNIHGVTDASGFRQNEGALMARAFEAGRRSERRNRGVR